MTHTKENTILFTLIYKGEDFQIQTYGGQYHSLMALISHQLPISGFGLCSGMGSCGTCLVSIDGSSTLACMVRIDDDICNTIIELSDRYY